MTFEPGVLHSPVERPSTYRGVHWCKFKCRWCAEIEVNAKRHKLGRFIVESYAANAYDDAAVRLGVPERCNAWWTRTLDIRQRTRRLRAIKTRLARG